MQDDIAVKEEVQGTGTWSREAVPDSIFASAHYVIPSGRIIDLPVQVFGEQITVQVERPEPQK